MADFKMPHSGHNRHLCYLINIGMQDRNPAEFRKLIKNCKYFCKKCGRAAAKPRNLCKPVKL